MIGNKVQPYKYSLKCAATAGTFCGNRIYCYIVPPKDAITIENLRTHLRLEFYTGTPGIPENLQKIEKIGIINSVVGLNPITHNRYLEVNYTATDKVIDIDIDLTSLLKKDNVEFWGVSYPENGTFVYVEFPIEILNYSQIVDFGSGPQDTLKIGDIHLWKIDALFTTIGIR